MEATLQGSEPKFELSMKVVLVPGLFAATCSLVPLRKRLEREGHECFWPGFDVDLLVHGELDSLARTVRELGPCAVVGHSAGGLLAVTLAMANNPYIEVVVGLGTPILGWVRPRVPYFEARSLTDGLLPLFGPDDVRRFNTLHVLLPLDPAVQEWVVDVLSRVR